MTYDPHAFEKIRGIFPHTKEISYFNSASYGPFATTVQEAIDENIQIRVDSLKDDSHWAFETADELRHDYAKLIGAKHREVGLGLNTTFGLNIAAYGLPLRKGDEVLVSDIEFPAAVYTWREAARARGLKMKMIKSRAHQFSIEELERAITKKTRVLTLSFVQFFNGYKNDLATIGEICRKHDIFFVVDGIQGMGVEPINVEKLGIDIFSSGCQKWMLAPQGCGFFYLSDRIRDSLTPPFMSWLGAEWHMKYADLFHYDRPLFDTARKFEMGYYVVLNLVGMKAAVRIFQGLGIPNIKKHNYALVDRLASYIKTNPYYQVTSSMEPKHRSSMVTFSCPEVSKLHREILNEKIILVNREGSIRVSVHLYNNESDIDRLIAVLDRFSRGT